MLCYKCGERGHFIKNCPKAANDQKKAGGRLYALNDMETDTDVEVKAETDPSVIMGEVFISSIIAYALIDSGSTHSHASLKFIRRLGHSTDQEYSIWHCTFFWKGYVFKQGLKSFSYYSG